MKGSNLVKGTLAGLACLGMMVPQQSAVAGPQASQVSAKTQIADVALTNGSLKGAVVNAQGEVKAGSVVTISQNGKAVAKSVTGQKGEFSVSGLNTGIYEVAAGETSSAVRVWSGQVAPPAAKSNLLIVDGAVARAQGRFGGNGTLILVGGAIIAAGTTIAIVESNDDDDPAPVSP